MNCQKCGHDISEHGKDGCYHLDYAQIVFTKEEGLVACECEETPDDICTQKGNQ